MAAVWTLMRADLRHHRRRLAGLGVGIALACALFVLAVGLGMGMRAQLARLLVAELPAGMLEVRPRHVQVGPLELALGGLMGEAPLDASALQELRGLRGVRAAYPVLDVALPMMATGGAGVLGRTLAAEIFMSALPEDLVATSMAEAGRSDAPPTPALAAPFVDDPSGDIPVLLSPALVALYNGTVAPALGLPALVPEALMGLAFELTLGRSQLVATPAGAQVTHARARVVGLSPLALPLGVSVPLATGRRLLAGSKTATGTGAEASERYRAILVQAEDAAARAELGPRIEGLGLHLDDGAARVRAGMAAMVWALATAGLLALALAGIGVLQAFWGYVEGRGPELALLRTAGATPAQVGGLMLAEATGVGLGAGVLGAAVGAALSAALNAALGPTLAAMPLLPPAPFLPAPWVLAATVLLGLLTAALGALLPAVRAARATLGRGAGAA